MVIEVAVAQAQGQDALFEEFGEGVLNQLGIAVIGKAGGELVDEAKLGFDSAGGSSPPASEVTGPPSKWATTSRRPRGWKRSPEAVQSVMARWSPQAGSKGL